jgi:biotin carboxylase
MKRRLLLLVTTQTYRAGAFIAASRALDLELTVASERPQALAAMHPEGHLVIDFRTPDAALALIREFAREHPVHAVIGADDECAVLAARAAEMLGLRGAPPAAVAAARDKLRAREMFAAAGLHTPPFAVLSFDSPAAVIKAGPLAAEASAELRAVGFPCVLKPRGLSASRGVIRADDAAAFAAAFARIRRILEQEGPAGPDEPPRDSILVERFIPGREVALEGLVTGGSLRVLALFDKPDPLDGPFFEETLYVAPSRLSGEQQRQVIEATVQAARALDLRDGPVHAEFRVNAGGAWPIEIAPRSIGGLCSRAVRFEGGDSLEMVLLRHALSDPAEVRPDAMASGVMMIPIPGAGRLRAVRGVDEARAVSGIVELSMTRPLGSDLVPLPEGAQYLGFIFSRGDDPERAERSLRESHGRLKFDIEVPAPAGEEIYGT